MTPTGLPPVDPDLHTVVPTQWRPGSLGPAPDGDRTEIRWARFDGTELVVKACGAAGRDRLAREAEVLRRCGDLPVAELVAIGDCADHSELVTRRFGSVTLAEAGLLGPRERGAALAGLCRAVGQLHDAGWAHGDLVGPHVLVEPAGDVRLCSLAGATEVPTDRGSEARAADEAALCALVLDVLSQPCGFDSAIVRFRWARAGRRATAALASARGLRPAAQVADVLRRARVPGVEPAATPPGSAPDRAVTRTAVPREAAAPDTSAGGTAAQEAAAPEAVAGEAVAGETAAPEAVARQAAPPVAGRRRGVPRWLVGVAALAAALALPLAARATDRTAPEGRAPVDQGPERPTTSAPCADSEGDGGCEEITVDGRIVGVGDDTFEVGDPGDVVRAVDWDCDGRQTVALLRPSTGDVFAFPGWAERGRPLEGERVATVAGATDLRVGPACGPPEVVLGDGSTARVTGAGTP